MPVPDGIDRVDVAGGTLSGWSALLTMVAAQRLAMGGEVTVIDLSGGAVAADLVDLSVAAGGIDPAVWVLPRDLPRLDLAASLSRGELADVLALSVSVAEERSSARELAVDSAILDRVIGTLEGGGGRGGKGGGPISLGRVAAALRALAQVGDVRADVAAGLLTDREAAAVAALYGQGATDRVVLERALGIEAQLRKLAEAGREPAGRPRSRLRVVAIDKRVGPLSAKLLGSFVVTTLTHLAGRVPASGGPTSWRHTLIVLGAERLRDDVLDRLTDACESARTGLVLAYRSVPPPVRQRIGRGNAAVAFMRLGNAEEAKAASEQIGTEHRFVVSQLTETVGTSVTDTLGGSYTSTVGDSVSAAASTSDSVSTSDGTGYSRTPGAGVTPFGGGRSRSAQAGDLARDERVRLAYRRDQHKHRLGGVHLAGDRGQRVARPIPAALAGTGRRAVRAAAAAGHRHDRQLRRPRRTPGPARRRQPGDRRAARLHADVAAGDERDERSDERDERDERDE